MGSLADEIGHQDVIGYADDTYVVVPGESTDALIKNTETLAQKHVNYLQSIGMVVNPSKTEIVIFGRKPPTKVEIDFAGSKVISTDSMKALGITITNDLSWEKHLTNTIYKSQSKLSLLRKIRPFITKDQFLKIATCQIFGTLYYAAPVWLNVTITKIV
jgi:hypothetical protein